MYIVIEGQDATGKSTQVEMMAEYLRKKRKKVITLHEPDGTLDSMHELRKIIKDKRYDLDPLTHVLLFTAARNELWTKLALPTLKKGGYVISARNWWSTLAYQGYGQGLSTHNIARLTKLIMPESYVLPDAAVILTLPDYERKERATHRNAEITNTKSDQFTSQEDTFESKPSDFQKRVNEAYEEIAEEFHIQTLDASPSPEEIHQTLIKKFGL